jgi:hypothetical protein
MEIFQCARHDGAKRREKSNHTLRPLLIVFRFFRPMPKAARTKEKVKPGKKVGRRGWTTEAQEAWLIDRVKNFVEAQGNGNGGKKKKALDDFWPGIWEGWFAQWPEATLESENGSVTNKENLAIGRKKLVSVRPSMPIIYLHGWNASN